MALWELLDNITWLVIIFVLSLCYLQDLDFELRAFVSTSLFTFNHYPCFTDGGQVPQ